MKKLRWRLVKIVFFSVVVVFAIMNLILMVSLRTYNNSQADQMTRIISENNGTVPKMKDYDENSSNKQLFRNSFYEFNEESAYRTRYFSVSINADRQIKSVDMDHVAAIDEKKAVRMTKLVLFSPKEVGNIGNYRFRKEYTNGVVSDIIFLDCKESQEFYRLVVTLTISVSVLLTLLITIIFIIASKRVVRPFEVNSQRQKQFITDASHELKTPLAIISANAEVLQYKGEQNEWLQNIVEQAKRMGKLINQLLVLAKLDEVQENNERQEIDMKELVEKAVEPFHEVIEQKDVMLSVEAEDGLIVRANREQIEQLVTILMDNASKYVSEHGSIVWKLGKNHKGVTFSVANTTEEDKIDTARLFDRFYRNDSSRSSKTGGHGIGLSIAKKIVDAHKGSIAAKSEGNTVIFSGMIP